MAEAGTDGVGVSTFVVKAGEVFLRLGGYAEPTRSG